MTTALKATLLHNPKASLSRWRADELVAALREGGYEAAYQSTKEKGWKEAVAKAEGRLIVAGGDGTVAKICKLPETDRHTLAILPTGGANNIARSFGIRREPDDLARNLQSLQTRIYRIGTVKGIEDVHSFCEAVGIGGITATAGMVDNDMPSDEKREAGRAALSKVLGEGRLVKCRLELDGAPWEEKALLLEIMIISTIGASLELAPGHDPASDRFAVRWLAEEDRDAMIEWLRDPEAGPPPLKQSSAGKVKIETRQPLRIDDIILPKGGKATLTLDGRHVDILVPPETTEALAAERAASAGAEAEAAG